MKKLLFAVVAVVALSTGSGCKIFCRDCGSSSYRPSSDPVLLPPGGNLPPG